MNKARALLAIALAAVTASAGCLSLFGLDEPEEARGPETQEPAQPEPEPPENRTGVEPVIPPDADARMVQRVAANETLTITVEVSPADVREARLVANVTNLANETNRVQASATAPFVGELASRTLVLEPGESRMLNVTATEEQVSSKLRGAPFMPSEIPVTVKLTPSGPADVRGYVQIIEA